MSLLNPNINDIVATTIELRSKDVADSVTANNAILRSMSERGNIELASGGYEIRETLSFAENGNFSSYSGYDPLATAAQDGITAAQYRWAQYAVPIAISGLEISQNSGPSALINLVKERVKIAEATMKNGLNRHLYLDGTGNNGKNLTGLAAAVPLANTTGTYGGIDRSISSNAVWRNQKFQATVDGVGVATSATIQSYWNTFFLSCVRGSDKPTIIIAAQNLYSIFQASLQPQQRFMDATKAAAGFGVNELMFMGTPVVFEPTSSGIATSTAYFLNTDYLKWRPHTDVNMVALDDVRSTNQNATIKMLAWQGNLTCSGARYQGVFSNT